MQLAMNLLYTDVKYVYIIFDYIPYLNFYDHCFNPQVTSVLYIAD
jgi:hypothetical protein